MTTEQAIKELKSDRELYGSDIIYAGDGTPDGDLMLALDMGIAALKKQIPRKPYDVDEEYKIFDCPACLSKLYADDDVQGCGYCCVCGQRLDWSGDCE